MNTIQTSRACVGGGDDERPADLKYGLSKLAAGHPVVLLDEANDCGYLAQAAEHASVDFIALATKHGTGAVRVLASKERLDMLGIATFGPASHRAPVDLQDGVARGIRSHRAATIRAFASDTTIGDDFIAPGHVFPSEVQDCLTLDAPCPERAALEAMELAGRRPIAGYAELVDHWGRPADLRACISLAGRLELACILVRDVIVQYERANAAAERSVEATIPTPYASFTTIAYTGKRSGLEYVAFVAGVHGPVARVHVHRRCLLGDAFGSRACGCGDGLRQALEEVRRTGAGVVIYHSGEDLPSAATHPAEPSARWAVTTELASILNDLGARRISLSTNEPIDRDDLADLGIEPVEIYGPAAAHGEPSLGIASIGKNASSRATAPIPNANV